MIRILTPVFLALVSVALADKDGGSNPTPTAVPSDCCPPGYTLQGSYSIYAIMPTPYLGIGYCRIWQKDAIDPTKMKLDFDDSHSEGDVDICVNSAIPAHEAKAVTTTWQWSGIPNIEYKPQPWAITARVPLPSKPGDCDLYLVTAKTVDSGLCNVVEGPKLGLEAVTICRPKAEWDCEADSEGCDNTTIYYWNRHYFKYTVGCPISLLGRTGTECINSSYSYTITDVNSDSEIFSENGMGLINHVTGVPSNLQPYHEDAGNVNHSGDIPNSPPGLI